MKICSVVLNTLNNDSRVLKIAETLSAYHDVSIAALSDKPVITSFTLDRVEGIKVLRFSFLSRKISKKKITENLNKRLKKPRFVQFLNIPRDIRWDITAIRKTLRVLLSDNFDCYYSNDFNTLISCYIASRRKRAKLIYDSHELWFERSGSQRYIYYNMKRGFESFIQSFIMKRCSLVITVSDGVADELMRHSRIKRPLVIRNLENISNPLSETERSQIRDTFNLPVEAVLIVYQGALSRDRGIYELIEAVNLLPENIHLLLMGPDPQYDILMKIEQSPKIHYPGMIPLKLLYKYTSAADIGIAPIKTSGLKSYSLAFPNKFSQYMNAGLALCLYDIKESRNIFEKCGCGVTIPEITPESIRSSIMSLIENYDLKKLQKLSRDCFIQYYNWDIERGRMTDAVNSIFRKSAD